MNMDSGYERLEDQIAWYDRKSLWHQRQYKVLKVVSMIAAALVPLTAAVTDCGRSYPARSASSW